MIYNLTILAAITTISLVGVGIIGLARKKGWPSFDDWWNAEGVPIFIITWFVLGIIVVARGCYRHV